MLDRLAPAEVEGVGKPRLAEISPMILVSEVIPAVRPGRRAQLRL